MGAILSFATRIYAWAEEEGCEVRVRSNSPLYSEGEGDFLGTYFHCTNASNFPPDLSPLAQEWFLRRILPERLELARAFKVASRRFRPSAELEEELRQLTLGPRHRIAVHYRGTDKVRETERVNFDTMLSIVEKALSKTSSEQFFLATDDAQFEREIRKKFPSTPYRKYELNEVPEGHPRHFADVPPRNRALEALVNIFLISEADVCVRTCSFLSAFSKVMNPDLHTITVNGLKKGDLRFPDFEILQEERR